MTHPHSTDFNIWLNTTKLTIFLALFASSLFCFVLMFTNIRIRFCVLFFCVVLLIYFYKDDSTHCVKFWIWPQRLSPLHLALCSGRSHVWSVTAPQLLVVLQGVGFWFFARCTSGTEPRAGKFGRFLNSVSFKEHQGTNTRMEICGKLEEIAYCAASRHIPLFFFCFVLTRTHLACSLLGGVVVITVPRGWDSGIRSRWRDHVSPFKPIHTHSA